MKAAACPPSNQLLAVSRLLHTDTSLRRRPPPLLQNVTSSSSSSSSSTEWTVVAESSKVIERRKKGRQRQQQQQQTGRFCKQQQQPGSMHEKVAQLRPTLGEEEGANSSKWCQILVNRQWKERERKSGCRHYTTHTHTHRIANLAITLWPV